MMNPPPKKGRRRRKHIHNLHHQYTIKDKDKNFRLFGVVFFQLCTAGYKLICFPNKINGGSRAVTVPVHVWLYGFESKNEIFYLSGKTIQSFLLYVPVIGYVVTCHHNKSGKKGNEIKP